MSKFTSSLRDDLLKLMPGFKWTAHRDDSGDGSWIEATGIQTSGFNRICTVRVAVRDLNWFEAKIAGFGARAKFVKTGCGKTLSRAFLLLQDGLKWEADMYSGLFSKLDSARRKGGQS